MHELAERLLRTIRKQEFVRPGDRVAMAVSGGADSLAMMMLLLELRSELGIVLSVAHVNHKLRGAESDQDEQFVAKLAAEQGLELFACKAAIDRNSGSGLESAARKLRYEFFQELTRTGRATRIATAHTLDDQAETLLLRMFRGTGIRGLAGILPRMQLQSDGRTCGEVVRPLLGFRRAELREYLNARRQDWREDSSNQDVTFVRNRLRRRLMPQITKEFGETALEHLAELAEIARAEEELGSRYSLVARLLREGERSPAALNVEQLGTLPLASARRVVRAWIQANAPETGISFRLVEEVLELARGPAGKKLELPGQLAAGCARVLRRRRQELVLEASTNRAENYEYTLPVPGIICSPELGKRFEAAVVEAASVPEQFRQELLDPARLDQNIVIRNWRAGDRFWPGHTKAPRKVKELLADRHLTGREKKMWPLAVCGGEVVWMRGFAAPKAWLAGSGKAVWIREK